MTPEELAEKSNWLDGPKVVQWLKDGGLEHPHAELTGSQARRFNDWKNGSAAYVYTLDEILLRLDLLLSDVPAEFYLEEDPRGHGGVKRVSKATKDAIAAARRGGKKTLAVAQEFGVSTTTVQKVSKQYNIEPCRGAHKLDANDARDIRERTDEDRGDLAREYGVVRSTIDRIQRGEMWQSA